MTKQEKIEKEIEMGQTKEGIYRERANAIIVFLVFIWLVALAVGLLGRWNFITAPLFITTTAVLTWSCVKSIKECKRCNINLGLCCQYLALLFIVGAYKLIYWQFPISFLYLIAAIALTALLAWIRLKRFIKNNKETKENRILTAIAMFLGGTGTYFALRRFWEYIAETYSESQNLMAALIIAISIFVLALGLSSGVRYFVLDDERLLYPRVHNHRQGFFDPKTTRRWF